MRIDVRERAEVGTALVRRNRVLVARLGNQMDSIGQEKAAQTRFANGKRARDLSVLTSWQLPQDTRLELTEFIEYVRGKKPKRLNASDVRGVMGSSYRGTSVFMATLAMYATGAAHSIADYAIYNPANRHILIKPAFASPRKSVALASYANEYVTHQGEIDQGLLDVERKIYERVLADNDIPAVPMPSFMMQPFLLALPKVHKMPIHKSFEGHVWEPRPNLTSLNLLASLIEMETVDLKKAFPILAGTFRR